MLAQQWSMQVTPLLCQTTWRVLPFLVKGFWEWPLPEGGFWTRTVMVRDGFVAVGKWTSSACSVLICSFQHLLLVQRTGLDYSGK